MSQFNYTHKELVEWITSARRDGWEWQEEKDLRSWNEIVSSPLRATIACHLVDGHGFSVQVLPSHDENIIGIWGPDHLHIEPEVKEYNMRDIWAGLYRCSHCGAKDVPTQRYSFAGRCCAACRPETARLHEQPGWTD